MPTPKGWAVGAFLALAFLRKAKFHKAIPLTRNQKNIAYWPSDRTWKLVAHLWLEERQT